MHIQVNGSFPVVCGYAALCLVLQQDRTECLAEENIWT